ncbi:cytochrome c oxidase subunit 3 [Litoribrevibacter euphylliae]|uniref:Cytochrome c oxidase subunit 3 n=1 Tax=Litoribrevibacter euphylliae TaxID=1834034 RepID=A0ABV7H9G8_9GAMM
MTYTSSQATPKTQQGESLSKTSKPLPGDLAIWFFILAELAVFSIFFVAYAFVRLNNLEMFEEGFQHLNRTAGVINTLALITSSYFVVRAVMEIHNGKDQSCSRWLNWALVCGAVYVVVKLWEYSETLDAGFSIHTNTFYMFYFFLTFFHFAHVLLGMVVLAIISFKVRQGAYRGDQEKGIEDESIAVVESGASYWHMIDLLWIILFPLVYVLH